MNSEIDWSQFIPDFILVLISLILPSTWGVIIAYYRSDKFHDWLVRANSRVAILLRWLTEQWRPITLIGFFIILEVFVFRIYEDWKLVIFSIAHLLLALFVYALLSNGFTLTKKKQIIEARSTFLPIPIRGFGNQYWRNCYLDPPLGNVELGGIRFQLNQDSPILDTGGEPYSHTILDDRAKAVVLKIPEPVTGIKSVYILINSSNSKKIYENEKAGRIVLEFKDIPIQIDLILGKNIREWSVGNPGEFVRETYDPQTKIVWKGMNKAGTNAVIDCLEIKIPEALRKNELKKILFAHKSSPKGDDTYGLHFFIFGVSLEIEVG